MKDIVAGLEMYAHYRPPGAARCDKCGAFVNFTEGRAMSRQAISQLSRKGWVFGGTEIGDSALCPECVEP